MSDDFFSSVPLSRDTRNTDDADFAHAIAVRFGSTDLSTARLLPDDLPHSTPHPRPLSLSQPPPSPIPPSPPHTFAAVPPSALPHYLADPGVLVLDIRPHAAHAAARINHALSLSVPSTLLKRPLFSLSKLSQMLPSPSSRARFADWSSASCILAYDSDSTCSPDNSIIAGLLRKFRAEGFAGELGWVRGGFQAVWKDVRHLATTEPLTPEEDDPDAAASSGTLRTTHLPKAAFSLFSTTAAPPPQLGPIPLPNTPAPSASRAANPFFDTIRQNAELSHGITERIPLRLPRRVRRRIHDLPFRWLQDIARRSALRPSRHPGLDTLESGSESSDDPYTSGPDDNDPNVEEGTEVLAMQFYRIELAEQRRLRSIMEHHTRESQVSAFPPSPKPQKALDRDGPGVNVRTGPKSVPGTPHPDTFPFSITAAVEKGTKNRYTHIWPFEHARVRLHDGRHRGSHPGRRDKGKAIERDRSTKDQSGEKCNEKEGQGQEQDSQCWRRSSPAFGKCQDPKVTEVVGASSRHSFYFDVRSSIAGTSMEFGAGLAHPTGPSIPRVKIEYDTTEQDSWMSGPPTPATTLPLLTPPFYTPMEIPLAPTPMRLRPPQLLPLPSDISVDSGGRVEGTQVALPAPSLPFLGSLPSFSLRLPNRSGGLLPSTGEHTRTPELAPSPTTPLSAFTSRVGVTGNDIGIRCGPRREPSPVDDYVNASYVQPLVTRKRYIATQGPLPSTYVDFWTLVWEQNVHVIVMLTREVENAMVKCGSYWTDTVYGPLRLELLSTSPPVSPCANPTATDASKQGFFTIREPQGKTSGTSRDQPTLITRTFTLSHTSYPGVPPRKITHLQYLDWSDMNVPDDPRGVLDLVKRVDQAIAESTPGPSPGGSLSPGSGSGSQSPDVELDQQSLLSPTSAGVVPWGRERRGSEWRHPELDSRSGIAAFALGRAAPVLLHCSAGVGRTGGFIAVDAVLDGIRSELRENREEWELKEASRVSVMVSGEAGANRVETSGEFGVESTETGVSSGEESISDHGKRMEVDELTTDKAEKTWDPLYMSNVVPIHVSAGDPKSRGRHNHGKDTSSQKQCSSPESLVVHVPCAGTDVPKGTNVPGIDLSDPKEAGWKPSTTRAWVEQVSDQTHIHGEERDLPPLPSFSPSSRERSPGSTSNSSGLSALGSVDESMDGGESASARGSGSGNENRVGRRSDTGGASASETGSGSRHPPPSSVSKPGSGSMSLSTSGSLSGSSLLRAPLRDSSVTSISMESTDSLSPKHEPKLNAPLQRPSDMEIDCPPRSVSLPLQPTYASTASLQPTVRSRHHKLTLGSSPVARFSSPIPGTMERSISFFGGDDSALRSRLDLGSDELASPPQEFESGESADIKGSGKDSQVVSDESGELAVPTKSKSNLRLNTELSSLKVPGSGSAKNPPLSSRGTKGKKRAIPLVPLVLDDSGVLGASEHDQRAVDHPVIDYKLPRELHSDLSPPLISSFAEPICTVIQDMREQRMSLCQSLRQYVFVHAAVVEGVLRIVDEERELCGTSGDTSPTERRPGASVRTGGRRCGRNEAKAWFWGSDKAEVVVTRPDLEHGSIPHRSRPLHPTTQPLNHWSSEGNMGCDRVPLAPTSSSGVPSPSKGKRAPSPTELLREDKTGALSSNKRPSIHRKRTSYKGDQFSFESTKSSPVSSENGGSRDAAVAVSGTRSVLGRTAVPEKGIEQLSNEIAICGRCE